MISVIVAIDTRLVILKVHQHGRNLCGSECQYLEKCGPKIQDYVIGCNSNITSLVFISNTDYIPDACAMASLRIVNLNSTTSVQVCL